MSRAELPPGRLIAFYGDDFTGSAAVMEVLALAGLETPLFLAPPTPAQVSAFPNARAIGIAGAARAEPPDWMDRQLPVIFQALSDLGAPLIHYKICSTLDSAPDLGSIGRAAEIGLASTSCRSATVLVAAPPIGRYQAFGNCFAVAEGETFRLDRHPVMSRHPATPIHEADVRRHLAGQTSLAIGLVDVVALKSGRGREALRAAQEKCRLVAIDVIDGETLAAAGALIWPAADGPCLVIGSQGVQYALVEAWRKAGWLPASAQPHRAAPLDRIVAASGSCSAITARQIEKAFNDGFVPVRLEASRAADAGAWEAEVRAAVEAGLAILSVGGSPLLHTAIGPADPSRDRLREALNRTGALPGIVNDRIGEGLGHAVRELIRRTGIKRMAVAGGDSSSRALLSLGIDALTFHAPISPGASLLRAHSAVTELDGLEISLKGGQMGREDYFAAVRAGG